MKILHVVHSLRPGGMENGVVNLANQLVRYRVRTDVCCVDQSGTFADRLPEGSLVHELRKPEGFQWKAVRDLKALIRREKPDMVHSHNLGCLLYAGLACAVGARVPLLQGEHGSFQPPDLLWRRRAMRWFLYRLCSGVHTVSDGLRDELVQRGFGFAHPVSIVNGVDTQRFRPAESVVAAREAVGLPADAQVIGIVGRFIVFKRHDLLLDAFERLAESFPKLHLIIAGAGGEVESSVRDRVESSPWRSRILLTGFTSEPEKYYRCMDLLAMPSEKEGLSNALLEAMACGVAVLGSAACGNAEVLQHGKDGLLEDLSTADLLEARLREGLNQPARLRELGRQARETVLSRFSLESMAQGYLALYQSMVRG